MCARPVHDCTMLSCCIRRRLSSLNRLNVQVSAINELLQLNKDYGSSNNDGVWGPAHDMMQLLKRRFYILANNHDAESVMKSPACAHGPLAVDLKRNLLDQWWTSVVSSRPQVFGINTLYMMDHGSSKDLKTYRSCLFQGG